MNWSQRRIMSIAEVNGATRYLEIGVHKGETFLEVALPIKDAVDPTFLFDTAACSSPTVRFFQQTSDAFWTSRDPLVYDIIFIDGLHLLEQTLRDFIASTAFSHHRTVWLVDDSIPGDVFSAMRDWQLSFRERQRMNVPGLPWHGDVYKIVPVIHDLFPVFNYATITDSGNPQTLVWRGPRRDFRPRFDTLEAISRLGYFDIEPYRDIFNMVTEDEALRRLRADFAARPAA